MTHDSLPSHLAARHRAGMTLVELLIVLVITAILASAIGYAFTAELTTQRIEEARRAALSRSDTTEQEITRLLQGAKLTAPAATPAAITSNGPTPGAPDLSGPAVSPEQTTYFIGSEDRTLGGESGAGDLGCSRLTFTTTAPAVPPSVLDSTDDFLTQQQSHGPVGGLTEVSLSTSPVGDAGGRTGLFERQQGPADADPTQGGFESVLDPQIDRIGFQFWDGQEWVSTWSPTDPPRLPAAVRVSFTLKAASVNGAAARVHIFVVPIPASDADAQNPVNTSTGVSQ